MSITTFLACYAALLSSIGFGWNLYRDLQNKARLTVDMRIRRIVQSTDGRWYQAAPDLPIQNASEQLFLVANVANVGHRPVKWVGWGGHYATPQNGKTGFVIITRHLPIMLPEGESSSEFTDDLGAAGDDVKELFVYDSTGRNWYLSKRGLKKLKEERRNLMAKQGTK